MKEIDYSAGMVSKPFWFIESKTVVMLLHQGLDYVEIKRRAMEENLFGVAKSYRALEIYNGVTHRTKLFDQTLIDLFCKADLAEQKAMILISVMQLDRLFFEFMHDVYRGKLLLGITVLTDSDINVFFSAKRAHSETMTKWQDYTYRKLRNSYINHLSDSGLVLRRDKAIELTPPILGEWIEEYYESHELKPYFNAIIGRN